MVSLAGGGEGGRSINQFCAYSRIIQYIYYIYTLFYIHLSVNVMLGMIEKGRGGVCSSAHPSIYPA